MYILGYDKRYERHIADIAVKKNIYNINQILKILDAAETDLRSAHKEAIRNLPNHVKNMPHYENVKNTFTQVQSDIYKILENTEGVRMCDVLQSYIQ
jgi:hypothetical protein